MNQDREILRRLAGQIAEIAALPVHEEKAELWRRLNQLEPTRPLVWINEIPWHEMDVDGELTLRTIEPWAREVERGMRQLLYQWRHMPGDMVVSDYWPCPPVIHSTGFGITEEAEVVRTDEQSGIVSRRFHRQIYGSEDIARIKAPHITCDRAASEERYYRLCAAIGDILPVKKVGCKGLWFAPWDNLIRWWGLEEAMTDLILRPQLVHEAMSRLVDACLAELEQLEALNLLSRNDDNTRVGSGAYGYTDELPGEDFDPHHVRPHNMWGCATAQIFAAVSPEMHYEFALRHEMRWLKRWGLTYYGCCEPLDAKMHILRRVPNLRKVSMSPWVDVGRAAEEVGTDYVISLKPNPAVLAEDTWRPELVRRQLRDALIKTRGCHVEIVLKDISTVRYQPQRLWEWEKIAMELVRES